MTSTTSTPTSAPTIILVAGHWLGAWAWEDVLHHLDTEHSRAIAMTLPGPDGNDPDRAVRTLEDQVAAILGVMTGLKASADQSGHQSADQLVVPVVPPVVIVAHSGANAPVSLVLDRHPELVRRVVWVDSGPVAPGTIFAPDLPEEVIELPLPSFEVLAEQASLEGLSPEVLERFHACAVPEPGAVLRQPIELVDDARHEVPATLVCCSMPSTQVLELARAGHSMFAEVAAIKDLEAVDLPTGHWPMWSRPRDLAKAIQSAASRTN